MKELLLIFILFNLMLISRQEDDNETNIERQPLVTDLYTADPSAHVFNGKIYIYPSHDQTVDEREYEGADKYDMKDYHVYVMPDTKTFPEDLGCVLKLEDVPWAGKQLWAPDCVEKEKKMVNIISFFLQKIKKDFSV